MLARKYREIDGYNHLLPSTLALVVVCVSPCACASAASSCAICSSKALMSSLAKPPSCASSRTRRTSFIFSNSSSLSLRLCRQISISRCVTSSSFEHPSLRSQALSSRRLSSSSVFFSKLSECSPTSQLQLVPVRGLATPPDTSSASFSLTTSSHALFFKNKSFSSVCTLARASRKSPANPSLVVFDARLLLTTSFRL